MAGECTHRSAGSVNPVLRRLHSPDIPDLRVSRPDNEDSFCILVQAIIGPRNALGDESFGFSVCTPKWLQAILADRQPYVYGKSYLIIERYDYNTLWKAIDNLCQRSSGDSWEGVAEKLSKYAHWEFGDYRGY